MPLSSDQTVVDSLTFYNFQQFLNVDMQQKLSGADGGTTTSQHTQHVKDRTGTNALLSGLWVCFCCRPSRACLMCVCTCGRLENTHAVIVLHLLLHAVVTSQVRLSQLFYWFPVCTSVTHHMATTSGGMIYDTIPPV